MEKLILNQVEQGGEKLRNTQEFIKALAEGRLNDAESFLDDVRADLATKDRKFSQYDERWLDHRERELFKAFCEKKDWAGAKRVVEATKKEEGKIGRMKRLEELSGKSFDKI